MTTKTYESFSYDRKAYIKVPLNDIWDLGLINTISPYSRVSGSNVYLECVVDYEVFCIMAERKGINVELIDIPLTYENYMTLRKKLSPYPAQEGYKKRIEEIMA